MSKSFQLRALAGTGAMACFLLGSAHGAPIVPSGASTQTQVGIRIPGIPIVNPIVDGTQQTIGPVSGANGTGSSSIDLRTGKFKSSIEGSGFIPSAYARGFEFLSFDRQQRSPTNSG